MAVLGLHEFIMLGTGTLNIISLSTSVTGLTLCWVQYINVLRKAAELDKLRLARESMNASYPLTPNMWLDWCEDESRLATRYYQLCHFLPLLRGKCLVRSRYWSFRRPILIILDSSFQGLNCVSSTRSVFSSFSLVVTFHRI